MRIEIAKKVLPFSHVAGIRCLIPKSEWIAEIFPTRIRLQQGESEKSLLLHFTGPVRGFTVEQDLERGIVTVFGHAQEGYFAYFLFQGEKGIGLAFEKLPKTKESVLGSCGATSFSLKSKEVFWVVEDRTSFCVTISEERLSLGVHKAQDWSFIQRREDLKEIFPIWFRLGHLTPSMDVTASGGNLALLDACQNLIKRKERDKVADAFLHLVLAGFSGMLVPRLIDDQFQGISSCSVSETGHTPLPLLSQGAGLIRSLFFTQQENQVHFLPCLPPEFSVGRLTGLRCFQSDVVDLEWTKKTIRRIVWRSASDKEVTPHFQPPVKSFRLRRSLEERGIRLATNTSIVMKAGEVLYLDQFQK